MSLWLFLKFSPSAIITPATPAPMKDKFGNGLIQVFMCEACRGGSCFDNDFLIRLIPAPLPQGALSDANFKKLPAKTITGWTEFIDYPRSYDIEVGEK